MMRSALLLGSCGSTLLGLGIFLQYPSQDPGEKAPPIRTVEKALDIGKSRTATDAFRWNEQRGCVTCHTNGWHLAIAPKLGDTEVVTKTRAFASEYLSAYLNGEKRPRGQHGSVEGLVSTTAFLALSDAWSGVGIQPVTRAGLDYAWSQLSDSGAWEEWLQCNWPPFEADAEYGVTLMLVALGVSDSLSREDHRMVKRLTNYLSRNPPDGLHRKAMRLWAARYWPGAVSRKNRKQWHKELIAAQRVDGGWSMASMAGSDWKHDDGKPPCPDSESYPTAFSLTVLLQTGTPRQDAIIRRGIAWLLKAQGPDGGWFTESPRRRGKNYISRAANNFSLLVLSGEGPAD